MTRLRISILGAGSFGTAMAHILSAKHAVTLWGRDQSVIDQINVEKNSQDYLPDQKLHADIFATVDIAEALQNNDLTIFALPCQSLPEFLIKNQEYVTKTKGPWVNLAKGLNTQTFARPSETFLEIFGEKSKERFVQLSGPTFAKELVLGFPSGAVVASSAKKTSLFVQSALSLQTFRLYTSQDVVGVELGGALKNVMAIAVGMADGLGYGLNTRAGLITRCLKEMTIFGDAFGANPLTFSGLSGLGDLILTATGDLSRNRRVGIRLGKGEQISVSSSAKQHLAEGIPTAHAVHHMALKMNIDMPNTRQVYRILYEELEPRQAVTELLGRELKPE